MLSMRDDVVGNSETKTLEKRGLHFAYFIIGWDFFECLIAITAGVIAGSIALTGFGTDSAIEVFAASVVVWHLRGAKEERIKPALKLIALSFFALAAYIAIQASIDLITKDRPDPSIVGIWLNAVALAVMIPVAIIQRRTGKKLGNKVIVAQSSETWLSNYLSISLLVGLGLNAVFSWWWADPVVALLLAGVAIYEGREAWEEANE